MSSPDSPTALLPCTPSPHLIKNCIVYGCYDGVFDMGLRGGGREWGQEKGGERGAQKFR